MSGWLLEEFKEGAHPKFARHLLASTVQLRSRARVGRWGFGPRGHGVEAVPALLVVQTEDGQMRNDLLAAWPPRSLCG